MAASRLKLALVGPGWPLRGGIAQYSTLFAQELARHHDVLHVSYARQYPDLFFPGKTQLETGPAPAGTAAESLLDSLGPLSWRTAADRIAAFGATHAVIMWWHPFFAPCLGTLSRLLASRGVVSTFLCHNVVPHEGSRLTRVLSAWAFARSRSFIVHADELAAALRELAPAGAVVESSPHPIYDQYGAPPPRAQARARLGIGTARVLLFFGLIRAYKGVMTLIRAFAALARSDPDVTLVIAGECYEPEEPYRALIRECGLEERVRFENRFIPNEEVAVYFAAADVVTLPYHAASASGVIAIAYAMDRPVVATNVGGLPAVVFEGETGHLVPPRDPDALARAVTRVFEAGGSAAYAAGIARRRELFSWARMRAVIERLSEPASRP